MALARAIALNIIKSFVPLNLPGSQIIHILQDLNVAYRRTDMLADIRVAFGRVKYETQVTGLMDNQVVPEAWMSHETFDVPRNYKVHLKVEFYDTFNDVYTTEHRYMFEDDLKNIGSYKSDFPDYAIQKDSDPDYQYMSSQVVGVTKNIRAGVAPF